MKEKIFSALTFVKQKLPLFWNWLKTRENKNLFIAFLAFLAAPFLFLDHAYEFFTLILSMYANEYGGIIAWLASGKPIWQTAIACWAIVNVSSLLIYWGVDLGKIITSKIRNRASKRAGAKNLGKNLFFRKISAPFKKVKDFLARFSKKESNIYQKVFNWLSKRGVLFLYVLCLIPFIPYVGIITLVLIKLRNVKSGIWILFGIGILRTFLTVLAIYHGLNFKL